MDTIKQKLKSARPRLSKAAPLTYYICWGYAVTNIFLGTGMYFLYDPSAEIAVANILSYQMWGLLFTMLGLGTAFFLLTNNWKATRNSQLFGLALKCIWAIALLVRCFIEPGTLVITSIWLFFAYIQAVTCYFFIAKNGGGVIR